MKWRAALLTPLQHCVISLYESKNRHAAWAQWRKDEQKYVIIDGENTENRTRTEQASDDDFVDTIHTR